jgi:hypothetical protein
MADKTVLVVSPRLLKTSLQKLTIYDHPICRANRLQKTIACFLPDVTLYNVCAGIVPPGRHRGTRAAEAGQN